jgi:hypothetical protein
MPKGKLSVGDDTPDGEPQAGPKGPYITDESDDTLAEHKKPRSRDQDATEPRRRPKK